MLCSDSVSIPSTLIGRCESDRGMWSEWKVSSSGRLGDERTAKAGMEGLRERERERADISLSLASGAWRFVLDMCLCEAHHPSRRYNTTDLLYMI